jgi:hypothetical protein
MEPGNKGQVMLLTVIYLSAAVLGAAALAGLLVLYQLRQTVDIGSSNQAIFAADAGVECALFKRYREATQNCGETTAINLTNGAAYQTSVSADGSVIRSVGRAGRATRAFEVNL